MEKINIKQSIVIGMFLTPMKVFIIGNILKIKRGLIFLLPFLFVFNSCNNSIKISSEKEDRKYIENVLKKQEEAWNSSNFDDFMNYYLKSESLLFLDSDGTKYGWQPMYDQISPLFDDDNIPGKSVITPFHIKMISDSMFLVVGEMILKESDDQKGTVSYFSQLWKKYEANWKIVFDHTTAEKNAQM